MNTHQLDVHPHFHWRTDVVIFIIFFKGSPAVHLWVSFVSGELINGIKLDHSANEEIRETTKFHIPLKSYKNYRPEFIDNR